MSAIGNIATLMFFVLSIAGCGSGAEESGQVTAQSFAPVRIAFTDDGDLLSTDYQSQSVMVYDTQTNKTRMGFTVDGYPLAVGFYQGKVFVGNEARQCVEVYDSSDGKKLFELGAGQGTIPMPNDLVIDGRQGRVFVVDSSSGRIVVFSVDGPLLYTITDPALNRPTAIALDEAGEQLYVSDFGSGSTASISGKDGSILVFSIDGTYIRSITGEFSRPQGLALDGGNRLFFADALLGQVLVFDLTTGLEIRRLGSQGDYAGQHKLPLDVVFDKDLLGVYVTDYLMGEIESFSARESAQ